MPEQQSQMRPVTRKGSRLPPMLRRQAPRRRRRRRRPAVYADALVEVQVTRSLRCRVAVNQEGTPNKRLLQTHLKVSQYRKDTPALRTLKTSNGDPGITIGTRLIF